MLNKKLGFFITFIIIVASAISININNVENLRSMSSESKVIKKKDSFHFYWKKFSDTFVEFDFAKGVCELKENKDREFYVVPYKTEFYSISGVVKSLPEGAILEKINDLSEDGGEYKVRYIPFSEEAEKNEDDQSNNPLFHISEKLKNFSIEPKSIVNQPLLLSKELSKSSILNLKFKYSSLNSAEVYKCCFSGKKPCSGFLKLINTEKKLPINIYIQVDEMLPAETKESVGDDSEEEPTLYSCVEDLEAYSIKKDKFVFFKKGKKFNELGETSINRDMSDFFKNDYKYLEVKDEQEEKFYIASSFLKKTCGKFKKEKSSRVSYLKTAAQKNKLKEASATVAEVQVKGDVDKVRAPAVPTTTNTKAVDYVACVNEFLSGRETNKLKKRHIKIPSGETLKVYQGTGSKIYKSIKAQYKGKYYWVHQDYIKPYGQCERLKHIACVNQFLSGHGTIDRNNRIKKIPRDAELIVFPKTENVAKKSIQIEYENTKYWVHRSYVTTKNKCIKSRRDDPLARCISGVNVRYRDKKLKIRGKFKFKEKVFLCESSSCDKINKKIKDKTSEFIPVFRTKFSKRPVWVAQEYLSDVCFSSQSSSSGPGKLIKICGTYINSDDEYPMNLRPKITYTTGVASYKALRTNRKTKHKANDLYAHQPWDNKNQKTECRNLVSLLNTLGIQNKSAQKRFLTLFPKKKHCLNRMVYAINDGKIKHIGRFTDSAEGGGVYYVLITSIVNGRSVTWNYGELHWPKKYLKVGSRIRRGDAVGLSKKVPESYKYPQMLHLEKYNGATRGKVSHNYAKRVDPTCHVQYMEKKKFRENYE